MTKKAEDFFKRHMFAASLLIALVAAMIYFMPVNMSLETSSFEEVAEFFLIVVPTLTALFGYPIALTVLELFFLIRSPDGTFRTQEHIYDGLTLILGVLYTALYLWFMGVYSEETDSILYAWSKCALPTRNTDFGGTWIDQLSCAHLHPAAEAGPSRPRTVSRGDGAGLRGGHRFLPHRPSPALTTSGSHCSPSIWCSSPSARCGH